MWTCSSCQSSNYTSHRWCYKWWAWKGGAKGKSNGAGKGKSGGGSKAEAPSPGLPCSPGRAPGKQPSSSQEVGAAKPEYDKAKEKMIRDTIAHLNASLKSLPKDEDCTTSLVNSKQQLVAQLEIEEDSLRTMKPLAVRVQRTQAFVDKKAERATCEGGGGARTPREGKRETRDHHRGQQQVA